MIKIIIEDHRCETEIHGSASEAVAEIVVGIEQLIEAMAKITHVDTDCATAVTFATIKTRKKEKTNEH